MIGRQATLVVWAVIATTLVGCQIAALLSRGRFAGLGTLVRWATARPVGRGLLVLAWMWLGWHAFAR